MEQNTRKWTEESWKEKSCHLTNYCHSKHIVFVRKKLLYTEKDSPFSPEAAALLYPP